MSLLEKVELDPFDVFTERRFSRLTTAIERALAAITIRAAVVESAAARQAPSLARPDLDRFERIVRREVVPLLQEEFETAGGDEAEHVRGVTKADEPDVVLAFRFDLLNPAVVAWAGEHAAAMIVQLDAATREAIRRMIVTAMQDGGHPRDVARLIRPLIGLHAQWSNAVLRYQLGLVESGVPAARVRELVSSRYEKLLRARSLNIARTEILTAANAGKMEAWRQARDAGWLPPGTTKTWQAAATAEPGCAAADGQTVDLDDVFSNSFGTFDMPPAHPSCRCTASIRVPGGRR